MEIVDRVKLLIKYYKEGLLGGEKMPEDSNPGLNKSSNENALYFTLPMALNYQRNSYKLWESALNSFKDEGCRGIFNPNEVKNMKDDQLRQKLLKYGVALQPNKQPQIWRRLCDTLVDYFEGNILNLFAKNDFDIKNIKEYILSNKKLFPYLSGSKILNYWLYVMTKYTDLKFTNRGEITIAPDTHVLQASVKLGVITEEELKKSNIREITSQRWKEILKGEDLQPIDLHTPFWLWSRNGFKIEV